MSNRINVRDLRLGRMVIKPSLPKKFAPRLIRIRLKSQPHTPPPEKIEARCTYTRKTARKRRKTTGEKNEKKRQEKSRVSNSVLGSEEAESTAHEEMKNCILRTGVQIITKGKRRYPFIPLCFPRSRRLPYSSCQQPYVLRLRDCLNACNFCTLSL